MNLLNQSNSGNKMEMIVFQFNVVHISLTELVKLSNQLIGDDRRPRQGPEHG